MNRGSSRRFAHPTMSQIVNAATAPITQQSVHRNEGRKIEQEHAEGAEILGSVVSAASAISCSNRPFRRRVLRSRCAFVRGVVRFRLCRRHRFEAIGLGGTPLGRVSGAIVAEGFELIPVPVDSPDSRWPAAILTVGDELNETLLVDDPNRFPTPFIVQSIMNRQWSALSSAGRALASAATDRSTIWSRLRCVPIRATSRTK